jgi:hypothetical protein
VRLSSHPHARARSAAERLNHTTATASHSTPPGTHETFDLLTTYGVEVTRIPLPEDGSIDGYR